MDCEFWGAVIPAGRSIRVDVVADEEYIHVSQVALGATARNGRTTLKLAVVDDAEVNGGRGGEKPQTLCTLTRDACDQMGLDVVVDATFVLAAEGANDVHVSGWRQTNDGIDEEEEARAMEELAMEMSSSEEEEEEESDEESDEEEDEDASSDAVSDEDEEAVDADSSDDEDDDEDDEDDEDDSFETPYELDDLPSDGDLFSESESDDDRAFAKAMGVDSEDSDSDEDEDEPADEPIMDDSESESESEEPAPIMEHARGSDSESDSWSDSESEEPAPSVNKATPAKQATPKSAKKSVKEVSSESESKSESESESESASEDSDDDSSDEDESDSDDGPVDGKTKDDSSDSSDSEDSDDSSDSDVSEDINVIRSATKRLAESTPGSSAKKQKMTTPVSKKAPATPKTPTTDKKMNSDEYANAIVNFLKENPDTMMSALGGRVKKPKNFPLKLGEFIKSRSDLFKIDGVYVRLV